jgi:transposase
MKIIPEEAHYRQRMMNYRKSHTVVETSMHFRTSEKTVKKWWKRWDGTVNSLINQSRRPKSRPRKTSEEMLKHMRRVLKKHRWEDLGTVKLSSQLWTPRTMSCCLIAE